MRVIAGIAKGRKLKGTSGKETRPLTDRVKESLFSILTPRLCESRVLDIYAGTGGFSIEAVSRGALLSVAIDKSRSVCAVAQSNINTVGFDSQIAVKCGDAVTVCRALIEANERFDIIFADPPFQDFDNPSSRFALLFDCLASLCSDDGLLVLRGHERSRPPAITGLSNYRAHRVGISQLFFYEPKEA